MKDFKQDREKRFSGSRGGGFGRRDSGRSRGGFGGGRDRGPVTMHQAVCNQCGKSCEVPFRPTSGKPVYCNVCFGGKKEVRSDRGGDRFPQKSFDAYKAPVKTDDEMKRQFDMLNAKLDKIIKTLEEKKELIIKRQNKFMAKGNNSRKKEAKKPKKDKKK